MSKTLRQEETTRTEIRFREIAASDDVGLDLIADLHMELLSFGPMAALGREFIREICYRIHLEDKMLRVVLCEVDGRPAGFAAFTARSITFHRVSLKHHWMRAAWVVCKSIVRDPRRLVHLARAVSVVASRRSELYRGRDPLGEVISLAVRPKYLSRKFRQQSGVWLSEALVQESIGHLREVGVQKMRMLVDEDNKAPLMVYHQMGARFEQYEQGGEPTTQVWFDLGTPPHSSPTSVPPIRSSAK